MSVFCASLRSWGNRRVVLQIKWWLGISAEHKPLTPMSACSLQSPGFLCPFWCENLLFKVTFEQLVILGNFCFTDQKLKNKTKSYTDRAPSFHSNGFNWFQSLSTFENMQFKDIWPDLKGTVLQENDLNISLRTSRLSSELPDGWIKNISLNVSSHFVLPVN